MRAIKGFLFVMAGFFVIITAISLLMPSTVVVNRSVNIATDSSSAAVQIRDLESWVNWHPYFSGAKPTRGRLSNGNAYLQWERDSHVYRLEELIKYPNGIRVAFQRERENDIISDVTAYSAGLQNQVEWKAINKVKWYPWEKFGSIIFDQQLGPGMESSLLE
ncbi:MAG: hypothetical protein EOO03_14380, partial [Chitinophagaceae bacterium]